MLIGGGGGLTTCDTGTDRTLLVAPLTLALIDIVPYPVTRMVLVTLPCVSVWLYALVTSSYAAPEMTHVIGAFAIGAASESVARPVIVIDWPCVIAVGDAVSRIAAPVIDFVIDAVTNPATAVTVFMPALLDVTVNVARP